MEKKNGYINVDEVMPQVSLEQAAAFYGVQLPDLKRVGKETRTACFLACGKKAPTGDRALAIQADSPTKTFFCHNYGCGKNGNLVSLCDLMKPGPNMEGRPRGDRFKEIAADLQKMANGDTEQANAPAPLRRRPLRSLRPRSMSRSKTPKMNGLVAWSILTASSSSMSRRCLPMPRPIFASVPS